MIRRHAQSLACALVLAAAVGAVWSNVSAQAAARLFATLSANLSTGVSTPVTCTVSGTGCFLDVSIAGGGGTFSAPVVINAGLTVNGGFIVNGGTFTFGSLPLISNTVPTVNSAGTSPSVPNANGTATFRVNVGTGGTATTIVMTMPAATNGWNCFWENLTSNAANRAGARMVSQGSTTTTVTAQYQTIATGAALAFTASDIVQGSCLGF